MDTAGYNKEVLEVALKSFGQSETVMRVISMDVENAIGPGENFASDIYRVRAKVVLGDGRTATRNLILKTVPSEETHRKYIQERGYFNVETLFYKNVAREMEALMNEFCDTNDLLFCKMIHYVPYSAILLEDLNASGFMLTDRKKYLDMDHSVLVLRSLGRFHGMAKILEQRGIISRDDCRPYFMTTEKFHIQQLYYGIKLLGEAIGDFWGKEWERVSQFLNISLEEYQLEAGKCAEIDDTKFNCLNHGDCWSNNMLFKFDYDNRPSAVRFIDLQMCRFASPVADALYFIYSSVDPKIRRENLEELLEIWYKSLTVTLDRYGYSGKKPIFNEFLQELDRISYLKINYILLNIVVKADSPKPFDFEAALSPESTTTDGCGYDKNIFKDESLKTRWGPELLKIVERFSK